MLRLKQFLGRLRGGERQMPEFPTFNGSYHLNGREHKMSMYTIAKGCFWVRHYAQSENDPDVFVNVCGMTIDCTFQLYETDKECEHTPWSITMVKHHLGI